jgi:hypothetical protein
MSPLFNRRKYTYRMVAMQIVSCEPVSGPGSLFNKERTGNQAVRALAISGKTRASARLSDSAES